MTDVAMLRRHLAVNRFLPAPPPELMFCGDGDFRAIGAEFLEHLVHAGLQPNHRVLDIGCGIGRLAVPLTQYLDDDGSYEGVDPVSSGIAWCTETITPVYPQMRFRHLDLHHPLYNPNGTLPTVETRLPFPDATFDMVCMMSVLTHLDVADVLHYAKESARLLAPGGCCFITAFLMNPPARAALTAGGGHLAFDPAAAGPVYQADPVQFAAVAFDEDVLLEKFFRHGLRRRSPAGYGRWSGRESPSFQDICIFERG